MIKLRPILLADLDSILNIENKSFSAPFTRDLFEKMVKSPMFGSCIAEVDGEVSGYIFFSIVIDEVELLTIAVDERFRRQGIARLLLNSLIDASKKSGVKSVFLEVRPSNIPAQSLYKSFGFENFGLRKGYYKDNNEDAIMMKKSF